MVPNTNTEKPRLQFRRLGWRGKRKSVNPDICVSEMIYKRYHGLCCEYRLYGICHYLIQWPILPGR